MRKHVLSTLAVVTFSLCLSACQFQKTSEEVSIISSSLSSFDLSSPDSSSNASNEKSAKSERSASVLSSSSRTLSSSVSVSSSSRAAKTPLGIADFSQQNDVWRGNFPLTAVGKNVLPDFLSKAGLSDIANLQAIGGVRPLTSALCKTLFSKYQVLANIKADTSRCTANILRDGTFADGDPLVMNLSEFDGKYLLLMIDEEGLGQPKMFSYMYTIPTGEFSILHREKMGDNYIYYTDEMLYFVSLNQKISYTYNMETKKLVKKG